MPKSFFKGMVEEKGLLNKEIRVEYNDVLHIMNTTNILELIELSSAEDKQEIKNNFSKIDFHNGDLMHYLKFLALSYIKTHFGNKQGNQKIS
jgi:hypothetical protein